MEAAVEDANESVGQRSQSSVMRAAGLPSLVIERPSAGAGVDRGEGLQVTGVGQASVAGGAGQHDPMFAGALGDG